MRTQGCDDDVVTSPWPFVEREDELALLANHLLAPSQDGPRACVVIAGAGVGKTRLLVELGRRAHHAGLQTVTLTPTEATRSTPYGVLATLAPELGVDPRDLTGLAQAVVRHLAGSDRKRRLLVVDDAQLLDSGTAALVLHLVATRRVRTLVALRRGTVVAPALVSLWKDDHAVRLDLAPFTRHQHDTLVRRALRGPVDAHSLARLARTSRGNALHLRELIRGSLASRALRRDHGIWRWDGQVTLGPALVDLVADRLDRLTPAEQEALTLVALGDPLRLSRATALAGEEALTGLERVGLIRVAADGPVTSTGRAEDYVRMEHPVYGEVVLSRCGHLARRKLLRRLAESVENGPDAETQHLRTTRWRWEAGDDLPTARLLRACRTALSGFEFSLAEDLARACLPGGGSAATVALAGALAGQARYQEAESLLAGISTEVLASGDVRLQCDYVRQRQLVTQRGLGVGAAMVPMLDGLIRSATGELSRVARSLRAEVHIEAGELAQAVATASPVLTDARAEPQPLVLALENTAEAMAYQGRTTTARTLLDRLREVGEEHPSIRAQATATSTLQGVMCDLFDGYADRAVATMTVIYDRLLDHPDQMIRGLGAMLSGGAHLWRGTLAEAEVRLQDAVALRSVRQEADSVAWALALLAQVQVLRNDPDTATATLAEALQCRSGGRTARAEHDLFRAEAMVTWASGHHTRAGQLCREGADRLEPFTVYRASLLHLAVRMGTPPAEVADDLAALAAMAQSPMVAHQARHAALLAADDAHGLEDLAQDFAVTGMWLLAAETLAQAARIHRRRHGTTDALRCETAVDDLLLRCGLERLPWGQPAAPLQQLTRREREISLLAARGLSNTEIAGELVVSVRTVESHLYNAFAKLQVTGRDQLRTLLGPVTTPSTPPRPTPPTPRSPDDAEGSVVRH
ncbi:MAG TPA: AAA family ATPase [Candidatus Avipropionibacterium avicola]|uniref:AAA family ATPase n=1 Tax=Candidatus Avipropionibacterium avicola TaxID=2840701 RepID=A0A9D1GZU1_9ACTN|nr:AAA family ATPase [Candidatus Avipropionibacterium avicola]